MIPEDDPVKEGHSFSGWTGLPAVMPANDVVVSGTFTINKYTVSYVIDNEVFKEEQLEFGAKIVPPDAPVKEGFDFAWGEYPETMPAKSIVVTGTYTTGINGVYDGTGFHATGDYYTLKGLDANETVNVYNGAGEIVQKYTASDRGELTIYSAQLSMGVNIIKSKNQSFKVIRK